jgi:hypothetical protein
MDDIYFSDKKKKSRKDEPSPSKRYISDKFTDTDFDDNSTELELKSNSDINSKTKDNKKFKVNLPDFDMDIPEPEHITAPSKDIYSSGGTRTPQGRRMAGGSAPQRSHQGTVNSRTPQGQRIQSPSQHYSRPAPKQRPPQSRPVKKKKGEKVCGDRTSYFKTDEGMFYAILSDGMGSGDNAEKQSAMLIEMLEHFIIQGIPTIRAIHLIHSIISLNNLDLMDSATLDLLEINLYSGETSMYKIGAAPSYLYSFDKIKMIHESNLSVGAVPGVEFHVDRKSESLSAGDVIVMTSDGVDIYDIQKLDYMISRENSMKLLARNILSESLSFNENNDDMTVLVVRMELRG